MVKSRPGRFVGHYCTLMGEMTLASDGEKLAGVWFRGQRHYGSTIADDAVEYPQRPELIAALDWLNRYFAGEDMCDLPEMIMTGSEWQKRVWCELLMIPRGHTMTYGELARRLGSSARAVGGAVGRNPLSVIVPCHRVTGVAGLTGYAAGLEIKRRLLEIESGCK